MPAKSGFAHASHTSAATSAMAGTTRRRKSLSVIGERMGPYRPNAAQGDHFHRLGVQDNGLSTGADHQIKAGRRAVPTVLPFDMAAARDRTAAEACAGDLGAGVGGPQFFSTGGWLVDLGN